MASTKFQRGAPPPAAARPAAPAARPAAPAARAAAPAARAAAPRARANPVQARMAQYQGAVSEARFPQLPASAEPFLVRFTSVEEPPPPPGKSPWSIIGFTVEQSSDPEIPEGYEAVALFCVDSKSLQATAPKINALCAAAAGFDDPADFFAWDAESEYYAGSLGEANALSEQGYTLVGRRVWVTVRQGKPTADGADYYREYSWAPVPEEEQ